MVIFLNVFLFVLAFAFPSSTQGAYDVLHRPDDTTAIAWLSQLEVMREATQDTPKLREISIEISATLAGKYGLRKTPATAAERATMIASIANTRKYFANERNVLDQLYFSENQNECWGKLNNDPAYAAHMGAVLAVDALAKRPATISGATISAAIQDIVNCHEPRDSVALRSTMSKVPSSTWQKLAKEMLPPPSRPIIRGVKDPLVNGILNPRPIDTPLAVQVIQETLQKHMPKIMAASGKKIVVFFGHTGAGKSFITNLLAEKRMVVNGNGLIELEADEKGLEIGHGLDSATTFPESLQTVSDIMLWDCPGFKDTRGASSDCMAAAFIRFLITIASEVKVVFVTSDDELKTARGKFFESLQKAFEMFDSQFVNSCCLLAVNKVDQDIISRPNPSWSDCVFGDIQANREILRDLLSAGKVIPLRKPRIGNDIGILGDDRRNLERAIVAIQGREVRKVAMSLTYSTDTKNVLIDFFLDTARKTFYEHVQTIYTTALEGKPVTSANINSTTTACWKIFIKLLESNSDYNLLKPVALVEEQTAREKYMSEFISNHKLYAQQLIIEEQQQITQRNRIA